MKTKKISRFLCLLVSVAMVFTMLPAMSITAYAASTTPIDLPTIAGSRLTDGNTYTVNGNISISANSGYNALNVDSGATVVIYIPTGYTLSVYGGNGYSTAPGGAGIYLPSNSTLILTGGGRLVAKGGNSGYSSGGYSGGSGYINRYGLFRGDGCTGSGGIGGYGAGGAGAGIGGNGGSGGSGGGGGSGYGYYSISYYTDGSGNSGSSGTSGRGGSTMGTLYVLGTVSVTANGGAAAGGAGGGSWGSYTNRQLYDNGPYYHNASGGGGGGGGGSTASASAIGGGSGGAGGGGGGGAGSRYSSRNTWWTYCGYGGGAGSGGYSGSTGPQESSCGTRGGWGGNGGSRGGSGSAGTLYKSANATVNGRNADGVANNHAAVSSKITLDNQGGQAMGATTIDVSYGDFFPNVKVPTKDLHSFMGYYTAINGGGTRYFDHRGAGLRPFENIGDITLYAHWVQSKFNVTFDKQTGTGGTDSIITGEGGTLTSITPPTKEHAKFMGYYDKAAGDGTMYYDTVGTPVTLVTGKEITANSVLYACWKQTEFRLTFGRQGGTGGTDYIYTTGGGKAPTIEMPIKQGAAFRGYFTQSTGGTEIYSSTGTPNSSATFTKDTMLYAQWNEANYNIAYVLGGGTAAGAPTSRAYSKSTTIPPATRTGYTFLGWQVDQIADVRHRALTIPAFATDYARDITLTAIWAKGADTAVQVLGNVTLATGNEATLNADLANSFDTVVPDNNKGVTSSDLANDKQIKLVLSVDKLAVTTNPGAPSVPGGADDQTMIDSIVQGTVLSYYDIKAFKEVTDGANTTKTDLLEIPEPIAVKIPLTGELAGKKSYSVYRVHEGKAEPLPSGPTGREYYSVEDGNIVIRTRKFSTYGVIGAESQIGAQPGELFERGGENVDVQGRVLEGAATLVYKVDIAWGPMAFEYSLDKEWDPVTHMYTEGSLNAWRPTNFDGVNNKIRSINHSNGAVKINLAVTKNDLKGVDMSLHMFNEVTSALAPSFILPPAPVGSFDKDLEPAAAYLFLSGPPEKAWIDINKTNFAKVGVITVTVEPHTL